MGKKYDFSSFATLFGDSYFATYRVYKGRFDMVNRSTPEVIQISLRTLVGAHYCPEIISIV